MKVTDIRRPLNRNNVVKLYATVASRSREGVTYTVIYLRGNGMKRWICPCTDFMLNRIEKHQHCEHIKEVRAKVESA